MLNNSLSTLSPEDRAALDALTGGLVEDRPIAVDPVDLSIAYAVSGVRGQIVAEAKTQGIGVRELARRMDVSASAVSRHLRSEGDMRISTAVLFANALDCNWQFNLQSRRETLYEYFNYQSMNANRILTFNYDKLMDVSVVNHSVTVSGLSSSGVTTMVTTSVTITVLSSTTPSLFVTQQAAA